MTVDMEKIFSYNQAEQSFYLSPAFWQAKKS
jgi:hypothetical protein